jgi:hypothetical protein
MLLNEVKEFTGEDQVDQAVEGLVLMFGRTNHNTLKNPFSGM